MKNLFCVLLALLAISCDTSDSEGSVNDAYPQSMREFVIGISQAAKSINPSFLIIPQNGIELVADDEDNLTPYIPYLAAIDANGQEDLFYGYDNDNDPTPPETSIYLMSLLSISKDAGKTIFVTDYCSTAAHREDSRLKNVANGYVSFAAPERNLNVIPEGAPQNENNNVIRNLGDVKNFVYLINPENYTSKQAFIDAVKATNYDLAIVDLFFGDVELTAEEVAQLKIKANGGQRLVICYMSIGEAEDYRYYWNGDWGNNLPEWIAAENPDWPGNYKVKYWNEEWQNIIYKSENSYLRKITAAGYDGVYLDIIDAFEYFEQ